MKPTPRRGSGTRLMGLFWSMCALISPFRYLRSAFNSWPTPASAKLPDSPAVTNWTSPNFSGHRSRYRRLLFKLHGAEISQGRVAATPGIEAFDIGKDGRLRLLPDLKPSAINQLGFHAKKLSTTALSQQFLGRLMEHCKSYRTSLLVLSCRILAAAIRVMERRPRDLPLVNGHRECRVRQLSRDARSHGPAHDPPPCRLSRGNLYARRPR
jgi:hypothetical protein